VNAPLLSTLAIAAATIGILHTLAPDHWLPIAAVSRARNWTQARTARVALLCGFGHVTVSVLLGLVALISGTKLVEAFGARSASVAGVLLIGFGLAYLVWGARHAIMRKLHGHSHQHFDHVHDPSQRSTWTLFAIYCADPCIAVIPIIFAAAPLSVPATIAIVLVYEAATIATMVGLTVAARAGASLIRGTWVERYGDSAAGALIAATGIFVASIGI
jgi:nickel/cobalt exporter